MDDPEIEPGDLHRTLRDLAFLNRYFGVHDIVRRYLVPRLRGLDDSPLHVLDVGTGLGDCPVALLQHGNPDWRITATDNNPATIEMAREYAKARLSSQQFERVSFEVVDLECLPYSSDSFDVVMASQVLHHFDNNQIPDIVKKLDGIARHGVFVQDLHRHLLPLVFIWLTSRALRLSPLVQHDGPVSVRKGFRKAEVEKLFLNAGLPTPMIRWHPAFRWIISTLPRNHG